MTEGIKMYHLDKKQIQEITDYIFLEDRLERSIKKADIAPNAPT